MIIEIVQELQETEYPVGRAGKSSTQDVHDGQAAHGRRKPFTRKTVFFVIVPSIQYICRHPWPLSSQIEEMRHERLSSLKRVCGG